MKHHSLQSQTIAACFIVAVFKEDWRETKLKEAGKAEIRLELLLLAEACRVIL